MEVCESRGCGAQATHRLYGRLQSDGVSREPVALCASCLRYRRSVPVLMKDTFVHSFAREVWTYTTPTGVKVRLYRAHSSMVHRIGCAGQYVVAMFNSGSVYTYDVGAENSTMLTSWWAEEMRPMMRDESGSIGQKFIQDVRGSGRYGGVTDFGISMGFVDERIPTQVSFGPKPAYLNR